MNEEGSPPKRSGLAEATDALLTEVEALERQAGISPLAPKPLRDTLDPTPKGTNGEPK